jgi:adenylylsulfate kinase-like enzyme
VETCELRDPKGLYRRARLGEIPNFTGISSPYEPPEAPELVIDTETSSAEAAALRIMEWMQERGIVRSGSLT